MRSLWTPVLLVALSSCVPATTERHPKGGFSVHLVPSPATAGKPFATADGWMITFEKTALRPILYASSGHFRQPKPVVTSSAQDERAMAPAASCELRLTQMDVGDAVIKLDLALAEPQSHDSEIDRPCGLDPATLTRLESRADDSPYSTTESDSQELANVGFVAHADKNGRTIHLSLFVNTWNAAQGVSVHDQLVVTTVQPNKGVPENFTIYFESIFLPDKTGDQVPAPPAFDEIAKADADGDGNVTVDELRSVVSCGKPNADGTPSDCHDLFEVLGARMAYVIAVPDAPEVPDPSAYAEYDYSGDDDDLAQQVGDKL